MEQIWAAEGRGPRDLRADPRPVDFDCEPASRKSGLLGLALARAGAAALLGLALLALVHWRAAGPVAPPLTVESAYVADATLTPLIALGGPPRGAAPRYIARSREATGGRRDTLAVGDWGADGLLLRLTLRARGGKPTPDSIFVETAMQAAEFGAAVLRASNGETILGARASFEYAQVKLAGGTAERNCLGFRLLASGENELSGLACGASDAPFDRPRLECLIDALSLTEAGVSAGLSELLPGAPTRRAGCARGVG